MYANESIESTHREHVHFQGSNSMALSSFLNKYCSSCSRFGTHIVSTVILTNYECTHKATQQDVFESDFIDSQNHHPHDAHLLALSHIMIYSESDELQAKNRHVHRYICIIKINEKITYNLSTLLFTDTVFTITSKVINTVAACCYYSTVFLHKRAHEHTSLYDFIIM